MRLLVLVSVSLKGPKEPLDRSRTLLPGQAEMQRMQVY